MIAISAFLAVAIVQGQLPDTFPRGWHRTGPLEVAAQYHIAPDTSIKHGGSQSLRITAVGAHPTMFASAAQVINAGPYRGKRVRLTAWVRTRGAGSARVWLRVDGRTMSSVLDNMDDRPVAGDSEWTRVELVHSIAREADVILIGAMLGGAGSMWVDDFELIEVETNVQFTPFKTLLARPAPYSAPILDFPTNLGFEPGH